MIILVMGKTTCMNDLEAFPLTLDFDGKHYDGMITPSMEIGNDGQPVYYRVAIDKEFFAYLCCGNKGWMERDGEGKPSNLVTAIGDYINEYYDKKDRKSVV